MSEPRLQEYVVFFSPGTMVSETTSKPIDKRDTKKAVEMAEGIVERHGARPYGFMFESRALAEVTGRDGKPMPLSSGGHDQSGMHFLGGELLSFDEVKKRNDPKDSILLSNMECNGMWWVVQNRNSYLSTMPFNEDDCIVDEKGVITQFGNAPSIQAYRDKKQSERDAEWKAKHG